MLFDDGPRRRPPHSTAVRALFRRLQKQDGGAFEQDRAPAHRPPPDAPPPITNTQGFAYLMGVVSDESTAHTTHRAKDIQPASSTNASTPAAAVLERRTKSRRHRRPVTDPGYRYEYLPADDDADNEPDAESLGFAGTAPRRAAAGPAGLIAMADNEFGSGSAVPMTPSNWDKTV